MLRRRRLAKHQANAQETENLLALADQGVRDAETRGLSADGRFVMAYGAAQALCAAVLQAMGYRARGLGHHETLFRAVRELEPSQDKLMRYFNRSRQKRNTLIYNEPEQASDTEVKELVKAVKDFRIFVESWLKNNHPSLLK
jgi:hypothetical protein